VKNAAFAFVVASLGASAGCTVNSDITNFTGAPVIVTQPVAKSVTLNDPATFSVVATGDSLTYQWYIGTIAVDSATSPTLTISSAKLSDAGVYRVVVKNPVATVISDTASLVVIVPPSIIGYTLTSGSVSTTNQAYSSTAADQSAIAVSGGADLSLINPAVTKSGDASSASASLATGTNAGVLANGGTILINNGAVSTTGVGSSALFATGSASKIAMSRGGVTTTGASSYALGVTNGATIDVSRASLRSSSGTLASATNGSTLSILTEADSLTGQIIGDASSTLKLSLQSGARLSGALQNVSVSLDSASSWNVTATSTLTAISDPAIVAGLPITNIIGNGFTVYYLVNRPENAALGGRTYDLMNGGVLAPR
jgi:hypothetical protein